MKNSTREVCTSILIDTLYMYNVGEEVMLTVDSFGALSVLVRVTTYRNTSVYLCLDLCRSYL